MVKVHLGDVDYPCRSQDIEAVRTIFGVTESGKHFGRGQLEEARPSPSSIGRGLDRPDSVPHQGFRA